MGVPDSLTAAAPLCFQHLQASAALAEQRMSRACGKSTRPRRQGRDEEGVRLSDHRTVADVTRPAPPQDTPASPAVEAQGVPARGDDFVRIADWNVNGKPVRASWAMPTSGCCTPPSTGLVSSCRIPLGAAPTAGSPMGVARRHMFPLG